MESEVARLINESLEMDKTKTKKVCFLKGESGVELLAYNILFTLPVSVYI